jgi:protein-L-isoaspartate(D-aspartate) O-methyltransferase
MSQPFMVARLAELAELGDGLEPGRRPRVLEIGTGSGYQAAVLARLAGQVFSIERHPGLAATASARLRELGFANVEVHVGDGSRGLPSHAPFDAIVVTAAGPQIPATLVEQLADGGRLVMPVGERSLQVLSVVRRRGSNVQVEQHDTCRFVDLVGRYGWGGSLPPQA